MGYLTTAAFRDETTMPPGDVDGIEALAAGWVQRRLDRWSSFMDDRLRKRYAVPFDSDSPPATVVRWLTDLVTFDCYRRRGFNPTSEQDRAAILDPMTTALEQIKEAADSETGLFDLPLRADKPETSGIARGGPLSYAEASPYTWMDVQREAVDGEH